jgi:D-alanyl-lipoteichoic acid acyltransferase DltB (MBOAT superfamily)
VLFNSYLFICLFLPVTLLVFHFLARRGSLDMALTWLISSSLFFYGWWNPAYLVLIIGSAVFNFLMGRLLVDSQPRSRRDYLWIAVSGNLALLGYFKYANFFVDVGNQVLGSSYHLETIILPLAISFFTLQQVAYIVDAWRGDVPRYRFLHYALFVSFFPQLIAGPIVHHRELIPQFMKDFSRRVKPVHLVLGFTVFVIGLAKKVILADNVGVYSDLVFNLAEAGYELNGFVAWEGALAYIFQIYFDFSGYSDMAIGLALMFGFLLPQNFNSPYKTTNFTEFWNCWHITLSRFLRDYLYIPLGGSRRGVFRHNLNLLLTMIIGGVWHGAGWTFLFWGLLCGVYLVINSNWRKFRVARLGHDLSRSTVFGRLAGWTLTFWGFVLSGVFFRGETLAGSMNMFSAIFGANGYEVFISMDEVIILSACFLVALACPNAYQIAGMAQKIAGRWHGQWWRGQWSWRPTRGWAALTAVLFFCSFTLLGQEKVFLYFQF